MRMEALLLRCSLQAQRFVPGQSSSSEMAQTVGKRLWNDVLLFRNIWSSNGFRTFAKTSAGDGSAASELFKFFKPSCATPRASHYTGRWERVVPVLKTFSTRQRPLTTLQRCQSMNVSEHFKFKHSALLRAQFSTGPSGSRAKNLMVATYVSAAVGSVLLTAVVFRFYSRFKKRARGIEELDTPLYGRRSRILSRYRGYNFPSVLIDTIVNDLPWFEVRHDDVWVVSYPKAGTTWLQEIVYLISMDCDFEKAKATKLDQRFPFLEFPFPGHREVAKMDSPRFIKTHLPFSLLPKQFEEKKPKTIYIARNPKDTVVSLLAFLDLVNMDTFLGTMEDFAQLFLEGAVIYGPWTKHVEEAWEQRNRDNVLFVTYENLHKDFRGSARVIARFLGKSLTESQLTELERHCSFAEMRSNDSVNYSWQKGIWKEGQFLRKGKIGNWQEHLSPETSAKFDAMTEGLEPKGLQFVDN